MLETIKRAKLNTAGVIAMPVLVILGLYLRMHTNWKFSWLFLAFFCSVALILQFGSDTFKKMLQPVRKGSVRYILLAMILSFVLALIAAKLEPFLLNTTTSENPVVKLIEQNSLLLNVLFFLTTWIALVGEELATAAVTFPIFHYLTKKVTLNQAFLISSILSSIFFGMIHLPTYQWNWYQCIVVIGLTRIPFNYAWKSADSLRGGFYAHIIYDYIIFFDVLIGVLLNAMIS
ncbi:CPBP family glutamic-type intramembrane protease [Enterococcus sp. AZ109]|uniref:CPBP family glutamic-type intramembrane protease n=1 Tax=Enterococcus sp. AZ109 TaxID=2774634 RepID=UPI003F20578F